MPTINPEQLTFPKSSPQASKVLTLLAEEEPDIEAINDNILQDPVLAGILLRYANSPLYRRGTEISNVPTATKMIGLKNVRSAVVLAALRATCPKETELTRAVLQHSLGIAALCKLIARKSLPSAADDMELLGLLHDMGMMVLASNLEKEYQALFDRAHAEHIPVDKLEMEIFGFNHDQITARALQEFRLPKHHEELLSHFHQPPDEKNTDTEDKKQRAVLVLAHQLLFEMRGDDACDETLFESTEALMTTLGLDETVLEDILENALAQLSHFAR
ncbi:MAG TPA: HDOD domain-containing protein [Gammaproteobacteria bacterium]|nr:HDOD domain-containing protein [Gammaproteobacteria bacterium]